MLPISLKQKKRRLPFGRRRLEAIYLRLRRLRGRNRGDGLENTAGDLVGVALGVRAAILEIALVAVVDEAVRNADGRATVCNAVVEFVDRLGLVETGETEVVVRSVHGDVLVLVLVERCHEG